MATPADISSDDMKNIAEKLCEWNCCQRCILRFLGYETKILFSKSSEELKEHMESEYRLHDIEASCVSCLGVLQCLIDMKTVEYIASEVKKTEHEFDTFVIAISLPQTILIREHAIWVLLKQHFPDIYNQRTLELCVLSIKEIWKMLCSEKLAEILGAPCLISKSPFEVSISFHQENFEKECKFLIDLFPDVFKKRKNNRFGWEMYTRMNISTALNNLSVEKFMKESPCPPLPASCVCDKVTCQHLPIFMAGRYNKYSRELSQTPWSVDGKKVMETSVQELITTDLNKVIKADECKFSASGREDVDVRMLGKGRPFMLEFSNPKRIRLSMEEIKELQKQINENTNYIKVRDLQLVERDDTKVLKEGEEEKTKYYSCLCVSTEPVNQEMLDKLKNLKDIKLNQTTPVRVLHRRNLAVRERTVYSLSSELLDDHHFKLHLHTQAGTYVKEFVHGDFTRTRPCLGTLLGVDCDIMELDVENVDLNWPKSID